MGIPKSDVIDLWILKISISRFHMRPITLGFSSSLSVFGVVWHIGHILGAFELLDPGPGPWSWKCCIWTLDRDFGPKT